MSSFVLHLLFFYRVQKLEEGAHFNAVNVGPMSEMGKYETHLGPQTVIPGKLFMGPELGLTGAVMSYTCYKPGAVGLLHDHKTHEELYIVLSGTGSFRVDDKIFPICEGSMVRVSPGGKRDIKNTGTTDMLVQCIQYPANSPLHSISEDGVILNEKTSW